MLSLGHEPIIYAREGGPFSDHVRDRGVEVALRESELPESCEVVIGQDAVVAYELGDRYPAALHLFRACSDIYDFELPPALHGVSELVIVASDRVANRVRACAGSFEILRLRQPVDVRRLAPLGRFGTPA